MKEKIVKGLKWFFFSFIWLVPVFLAVDIVTKLAVVNACDNRVGAIIADLIPGFLRIQYVQNDSAAFGMGFGTELTRRIFYMIIASLGAIGISLYYGFKYKKLNGLVKACLMLIVTGAIGNLIDRIFYSFANYCVVDWIDFYGIWGYHFNIADCCIVIGAIALVIYLIVLEVKDAMKHKEPKPKATGKVLSVEEQRRQAEIEEAKVQSEAKETSENQVEN